MNILFVSLPFPWPLDNGGRLRRFHLVKELSRHHAVTLATLLPREPGERRRSTPLHDCCERVIEHDAYALKPAPPRRRWARALDQIGEACLSPRPRTLRFWSSPVAVDLLRSLYQADDFDAVWIDRSYVGVAAELAGIPRLVVDLDDLGTTWLARSLWQEPWRLRRVFDLADLPKTYWFERSLTKRFWRCVVCKEEDRAFWGRDSHADAVRVVPNGIDDFPAAAPGRADPKELLFVGSMDSDANADAVRWFCRSMLPPIGSQSPTIKFKIVGRNPAASVSALHDGSRVRVTGAVPDTAPFYESAGVVVAPIRLGSGTRLKVLEALARGKALVGTSIAIEGLDLRPGVDLLVADSPREFAAACLRLMNDAGERERLGQSARRRVYDRYQWESVGRIAEQVLLEAARRPARSLSFCQ